MLTPNKIMTDDLRTYSNDQLESVIGYIGECVEERRKEILKSLYNDSRYSFVDEEKSDFRDSDKIEFKFEECLLKIFKAFEEDFDYMNSESELNDSSIIEVRKDKDHIVNVREI